MTDESLLDTSTETDELGDLDTETNEDETDDGSDDSGSEDVGDENVQKKDYKQKFNSLMSNFKKLSNELNTLKSAKAGELSKTDLDKLREKYDEEDLDVIQKIIRKEIEQSRSNSLSQKEQNIFTNKHPDITDSQLKHLNWMQQQFGYSLEYAYGITFSKGESKNVVKHSIATGSEEQVKVDAKTKNEQEDDEAYRDMKKNYTL